MTPVTGAPGDDASMTARGGAGTTTARARLLRARAAHAPFLRSLLPDAQELADIACQAAASVRRLGRNPRVAFMSYSTFGNPEGHWLENIRAACAFVGGLWVVASYQVYACGELSQGDRTNCHVVRQFRRLDCVAKNQDVGVE